MDKSYPDARAALHDLTDGVTLLSGGFGLCGNPETALPGDYAIVKAWKGDRWGNLVYRKAARNFNPMMAAAGRITIAEVEHLVAVGTLAPDEIHTPGIYVQRIFQGRDYEKPI